MVKDGLVVCLEVGGRSYRVNLTVQAERGLLTKERKNSLHSLYCKEIIILLEQNGELLGMLSGFTQMCILISNPSVTSFVILGIFFYPPVPHL